MNISKEQYIENILILVKYFGGHSGVKTYNVLIKIPLPELTKILIYDLFTNNINNHTLYCLADDPKLIALKSIQDYARELQTKGWVEFQ